MDHCTDSVSVRGRYEPFTASGTFNISDECVLGLMDLAKKLEVNALGLLAMHHVLSPSSRSRSRCNARTLSLKTRNRVDDERNSAMVKGEEIS